MKQVPNQHIDEKRLEAYAMNSLDGDEAASVEEHLLFCETCQDQLETIDRYSAAMRTAAKRVRKEEQEAAARPRVLDWLRDLFQTPIPVWAGAIAMVLIVLAVGVQLHQKPGAPVNVELQANRGASTGTAPAGHALNLQLDNHGITQFAEYRVEIVNSNGGHVWTGTGTWSENAIRATVAKSFRPGIYYVRLLHEGEEPVREYQLVVQ